MKTDAPDIDADIVGLLLAAGRGTRFDPSGQRAKLLAPFPPGDAHAEPLLLAAARSLRGVLDTVLVVMRPAQTPGEQALQARLRDLGCSVLSSTSGAADTGGEGLGRSIARGVAASATAGGWIIALGDMPLVRPQTVAAVRDALRAGALAAAPYHQGVRGHPVGFAAACGAQLQALRGDEGARGVLARHRPQRIEVDDPGVLFDVDRPEDLARG